MLFSIKKIKPGKKLLPLLLLLSLLFVVGCVNAPSKGWSGPTVSDDGILYVGTIKGTVIALNALDGKPQSWKQELEEQKSSALSCGRGISTPMSIYGTPVVNNGVVYVGGYDGIVYATTVENAFSSEFDTGGAIIGSPAIWEEGNTLFVGNADGKLYALSTDNIKIQKWDKPFKTGDKIWSTPVVDKDNGIVYVSSADHKLYAIDAESGNEIWHFKAEAGILSTPTISDDGKIIYIGACDNNFYAINAATGTADWVFKGAGNWFWTKALVYEGLIYAGNLDGNVYAINIETGKGLAVLETDGRVRTPPVSVNGLIIVGSEDGLLYAIDPDNNNLSKILCDLEEPIFAPIFHYTYTETESETETEIEHEIIFVHAQDGEHWLYAIDVNTPEKPLWSIRTDKDIEG